MKLANLFKVFDTVVSVLETKRGEPVDTTPETSEPPARSFADQIESRLTNVVVAALKEAFDRDHARLELERDHLQEQRRHAEEEMRMELRREATDREVGRSRLLAGAGFAGWMACIILLATRIHEASAASRGLLIGASLLCVGCVGAAFTAQSRITRQASLQDAAPDGLGGNVPLWLFLAALGLAAISLVL